MNRYAADTQVSSERSRGEIERTLMRYGATGFMYGIKQAQAIVQFAKDRTCIRFTLPLPDPQSDEFQKGPCIRAGWHDTYHSPGCFKPRPPQQAMALWEQACRQKWRALALAIKAKLEAVESGITTFEEEFMAHIVLPGNTTVGAKLLPEIKDAQEAGRMPALSWDGR